MKSKEFMICSPIHGSFMKESKRGAQPLSFLRSMKSYAAWLSSGAAIPYVNKAPFDGNMK